MSILAIDPGNEKSAWLLLEDGVPVRFGYEENGELRMRISSAEFFRSHVLAVELDKAYTMDMSGKRRFFPQQVLETHFEAGRFVQAWGGPWQPVQRKDVRQHLCGTCRAWISATSVLSG